MIPFPIITPSIEETSPFSKISNGESHLVLLKKDGILFGSGSNSNSQLNQSTGTSTGSYNNFVIVDTNVIDVWCGDNSTIWSSMDGNLYFCGLNTNTNSTLISTGLKQILQLPSTVQVQDIKKIHINFDNGFVLITNDGRAYCHGVNTASTFSPYLTTTTVSSYTYFNDENINTAWVQVQINISTFGIIDYMLNNSFGGNSLSGTFICSDNKVYRYLNSGWNNITQNSQYKPNVSYYYYASTNAIGYNYLTNMIGRVSSSSFTPFLGVGATVNELYSILYSTRNSTTSIYAAILASAENLSNLVCLSTTNAGNSMINLVGSIQVIHGRTTLYSILTTTNAYILSRTGTLSNIDYSNIAGENI